jgi:hypothetical protein
MTNAWITHVKQYATENNVSYSEALKLSKETYTKSTVEKKIKDADVQVSEKVELKKPKRVRTKKQEIKEADVQESEIVEHKKPIRVRKPRKKAIPSLQESICVDTPNK